MRFPQRVVAETFAPNVEVEVVMAGSPLSVRIPHRVQLCHLQQLYAVSVWLRLLSLCSPLFVQMELFEEIW